MSREEELITCEYCGIQHWPFIPMTGDPPHQCDTYSLFDTIRSYKKVAKASAELMVQQQQEITQLRGELDKLKQQNSRLADKSNGYVITNARLSEQLAASQLREEGYQDALDSAHKFVSTELNIAERSYLPDPDEGQVAEMNNARNILTAIDKVLEANPDQPQFEAYVAERTKADLSAYLERQREWSRRTFGPDRRTQGIIEHVGKELQELREAPDDLSEWIDVVILALDGYWRHGGTPKTIVSDLQAKQDKNFSRTWPPPSDDDRAIEHIRQEAETNA